MDVNEVLRESEQMTGPLGAVAFVATKALEATGGTDVERETLRELLVRSFAALTDEQCNVLAEVAHRRLADRPEDGRWY